jgi:hypothetical protein
MTRFLGIDKVIRLFGLLLFVPCFAGNAFCEEPVKVTLCELKKNPAAYNHKLVEVTEFVSYGFENFSLFDPNCSDWPDVWLEYGGLAASGTIYCCGIPADRSRPKQLVVEGIPIPLVNDERFRQFDSLLHRLEESVVHATIVGRFFSANIKPGVLGGGYGHFGCCSLLAIQQVISVKPHERKDVDYSLSSDGDQPTVEEVGKSSFRDLIEDLSYEDMYKDMIESQRKAEASEREWAFSDARRVASDALARLLDIDEKTITGMKETRKGEGVVHYRWSYKGLGTRYLVVVSRPYWLSFYANDPKRVAWVVKAAFEID